MKREIRIISVALAALLTGCGIDGIHSAKPTTRMRANPQTGSFDFYDTKDNDLEIVGLGVDGKGHVDKVIIRNNASDVRRANGESQMPGMAMQATANWQGGTQFVTALFQGLSSVARELNPLQMASLLKAMPRAQSIQTPWGTLQTTPGLTDEQVNQLIQMAGKQAESSPTP